MIKANEVRIGNWVEDIAPYDKQYLQIRWENIGKISENGYKYRPIPLTPEILEACGFVNKPNETFNLSYELTIDGFASTFRTWQYRGEWYIEPMGYDTGNISIEYLHQLQNLYFALTGQELEVKELPKIPAN